MSIQVRCNAKVNLFLRIFGKREDGFHDIISMMQSVCLTDCLTIEETGSGKIEIECNKPEIPTDERNHVWRACAMLAEEAGRKIDGVKIRIEKNIPMMGGLAGGSSNAAGVLAGLQHLWDLGLEDRKLVEIASKIGSDVPFCYVGGTCLVNGRGDIIQPMPSQISTAYSGGAFLLVFPRISVNTSEAYGLIDKSREASGAETVDLSEAFLTSQEIWVKAIDSGDFPLLFMNDFESPVFGAYPELKAVHDNVRNFSGHALMSGSGSTIFAWYDSMALALAAADNYSPVAGEMCITAYPASRGIEIDAIC